MVYSSYFGCKDIDGDDSVDSTDQFDDDPDEWLDADNDGVGGNSDYNDNDDKYSTLEGNVHYKIKIIYLKTVLYQKIILSLKKN